MAKINDVVKKAIDSNGVTPIATASKDGMPNVVPFSFVKVYDDESILLADNFMNKSLKNLEENPKVSICVWDLEAKQAYQIKGNVSIETSGKVFDDTVAWVKGVAPQMNPKSSVLVKVSEIFICQPGSELGKAI